MAVHIPGLVAIVLFYMLIMGVGIWASRKAKTNSSGSDTEDVMLAGRNIGVVIGIFTMTATWVGGAYINATAEVIMRDGLVWCLAPFGYAVSLILGGLLFADRMRSEGYVTMLDPFQHKYGEKMGGLLFIPALMGEVFWTGAVLAALGSTLSVIVDMEPEPAIVVSACVALFYTLIGGLYSVAYTDIVQLFCIFIGLWISIPFAVTHEAVAPLAQNASTVWIKSVDPEYIPMYVDSLLLLMFGGVPWQAYFQRVLSSKTAMKAKIQSYIAAFGCIIMAAPAMVLGVVASQTNWNQTDWDGPVPIPEKDLPMILPMTLQYLCPPVVTFVGLGALSAAVMSSADSSILSAASMFSRNIYRSLFRSVASEREVIIVMRFAIFGVTVLALIMALTIESIYVLWYLCADLVYVILFPQLLCVVYLKTSNTYGSLTGYILGFFFRVTGGEPALHIPALIEYPLYAKDVQFFPFKSIAMLISLSSLVGVSYLTKYLFESGTLPRRFDVFMCIVNIPMEHMTLASKDSVDERTKFGLLGIGANGGNVNPALKFSQDNLASTTDNAESDYYLHSLEKPGAPE